MCTTSETELLAAFCETLSAIWSDSTFREGRRAPRFYSHVGDFTIVTTVASPQSVRLPITGHPIRGSAGVEVKVETGHYPADFTTAAALIRKASWGNSDGNSLVSKRTLLKDQLDALYDVLYLIPGLAERVFETSGYKHYEPDELEAQARKGRPSEKYRFDHQIVIEHLLGETLDQLGFDASNPSAFSEWDSAIENTLGRFRELASRTHNNYDVIAFLNAPLVDSDSEFVFGTVPFAGKQVEMSMARASDELLASLISPHSVDYTSPAKIGAMNSILKCRVSVPCNAPLSDYLGVYPEAINVMGRVTDVLRIVRPEDIGIHTIEVVEVSWAEPTIRKTLATKYQPEVDTFYPRRSSFLITSEEAISSEQIALVSRILPNYLGDRIDVQGLGVAMRRLRDSQEKYFPTDYESLLDIAIAFEAVFLNDTDNSQELKYRLCIRVARFLEDDAEKRLALYSLMSGLYNFRSKLAHGLDLTGLKPNKREELDFVFDQAPRVLRQALLKLLQGDGPTGLRSEELTAWWRKLELS